MMIFMIVISDALLYEMIIFAKFIFNGKLFQK